MRKDNSTVMLPSVELSNKGDVDLLFDEVVSDEESTSSLNNKILLRGDDKITFGTVGEMGGSYNVDANLDDSMFVHPKLIWKED